MENKPVKEIKSQKIVDGIMSKTDELEDNLRPILIPETPDDTTERLIGISKSEIIESLEMIDARLEKLLKRVSL